MTFVNKGIVLVAIPFLLQLATIGLIMKTNRDSADAQEWALHSKEVIARAEAAYRKLLEVHSALRGSLLTGSPALERDVERYLREVPGDLRALVKEVRDNDEQVPRAGKITDLSNRLIEWQRGVLEQIQTGRRDEAIEEVQTLTGYGLLLNVRDAVDEFLAEERALDARRMADLVRYARRQGLALIVGGGLAVVGAAVLAGLFGRSIARRVGVLTENAALLASGRPLNRPLEGRDEVAQLDRVFHAMARAIAEKDRENEMFIYSVSHDLRSPLVNLQGFGRELGHAAGDLRQLVDTPALDEKTRSRALALVDQDISGSIHFIQTAVGRLSAIIDALLRLSRAGRVEYRWQRVDVNASVRRVVEALGATIAERGATVTCSELPPAWGDPTAIEQIFANLIGNAVNYLDPERPGVVEVGVVEGPSQQVRTYYVRDNGQGIPKSGQSKLFYAFQRFHDNSAKGEGIGLALVRRVVERHGGEIRVESEPGVGTTFQVDLPARGPDNESGSPRPAIDMKGNFT